MYTWVDTCTLLIGSLTYLCNTFAIDSCNFPSYPHVHLHKGGAWVWHRVDVIIFDTKATQIVKLPKYSQKCIYTATIYNKWHKIQQIITNLCIYVYMNICIYIYIYICKDIDKYVQIVNKYRQAIPKHWRTMPITDLLSKGYV